VTVQLGTTARNGRLDAFETNVGTSPKFQIRTGAQPADCSLADSGTLLVEITLPVDWMNNAAAGSKTKLGTWSGSATGTGTPGHFRLKDSAGVTTHMQALSAVGSGDLNCDGSITSGQTVTVSTFTLTEGNP
jgi:hypothetical protein